jgi:hypothetical protein
MDFRFPGNFDPLSSEPIFAAFGVSPAPPFSSFSFHSDHCSPIPITFGPERPEVIGIRGEC